MVSASESGAQAAEPVKDLFTAAGRTAVNRGRLWASEWRILGALLAILLLTYSAPLLASYGFYHDYLVLRDAMVGQGANTRNQMIAAGRPIQGILTQACYDFLGSLGQLRMVRLCSVLLTGVVGLMVFETLVYAGWKPYWAFCMALIITVLPPFQVYASWALCNAYPLGAVASAGALYLAEQALRGPPHAPPYRMGGAVLLMLISVAIIQPALMFFWVLAAAVLMGPGMDLAGFFRRLRVYGLLTAVSLLAGFAAYQIGVSAYGNLLPMERRHLAGNFAAKVGWFAQAPLVDALNLFNLSPNGRVAAAVGAFILIGMVCYLWARPAQTIVKLLFAVLLVPLIYLPNLVAAEDWSSYRTQLALTSLVALYFFLAVQGYCRRLIPAARELVVSAVFTLFVIIGLGLAADNVRIYFVAPQAAELGLLRAQFVTAVADPQHIYALPCRWQDSIAPVVRYDEFGLPSCTQPWSVQAETEVAIRESAPRLAGLPVSVISPRQAGALPPGSVLVDMRKLARLR
jgi:hypothetical protein